MVSTERLSLLHCCKVEKLLSQALILQGLCVQRPWGGTLLVLSLEIVLEPV
jgi:hypothetical protein